MAGPLKRYPDGRGGHVLLNDVDAKKAGHNPATGTPRRGPVTEVPAVVEGASPGVFEHGELPPKGALPKAGPTHRAREAKAAADAAAEAAAAAEALVVEELAALSIEDLAAVVELGDLPPEEFAALAELAAHEETPDVNNPDAPPAPAPDAPAGAEDPANKARPAPAPGGRRRRPRPAE